MSYMRHSTIMLLVMMATQVFGEIGSIEGVVKDSNGMPIAGATVTLYGTDITDVTDSLGYYRLEGIVPAAPRYILEVNKPGYYTARKGDIDMQDAQTIAVNFILEQEMDATSYKTQVLDVRLCYLIEHKRVEQEPVEPIPDAVLDTSLYPDSIKPYLESGKYMDKDNPEIQALAQEILTAIPESLRTNATEVAKSVYLWVVRNIDYDLMNRYTGDVTCGNWQTVNGGWGKDFADWCYLPQEVLGQSRAICIEYERFTATILRALNIPARPAPIKAHPVTQWWVQPPDSTGYWVNMETSKGHIAYEQGDTLAGFPSRPESDIAFWWPNADAPIHNGWGLKNSCLWREVTDAGHARLTHDAEGLLRAQQLMREFEQKGGIRYGGPPLGQAQPNYELYTRGFQVDLSTVGEQKIIIAYFPLFINNEYNTTIDYVMWTNHPEWVKQTWVDILTDDRTCESLPIFYVDFDLMPVRVKEATLENADFEEGTATPDCWDKLSVPLGNAIFALSNDAQSGTHSAYIRNVGDGVAAFCQTVLVESGDVLRIDGWIKSDGVKGLVSIDVAFFGSYDNPPPYPGTYPRMSGTHGWTKVWGTYFAPPGTAIASIRCTVTGEGEAWFDNLKLLVTHGTVVGISDSSNDEKFHSLAILQSYPNPFSQSTVISYRVPMSIASSPSTSISLKIYDLTGRIVRAFPITNNSIGSDGQSPIANVVWDGTNDSGNKVASGVYFCTLKAGNSVRIQKMLFLR